MDTYTLVVSNPPHEKEVDASRAAPCFGLTAADVRMKANYVAPEIWVMGTVRSKMEDAARTLREAGLNVVVVAGRDLANIPAPARVKSLSFTGLEGHQPVRTGVQARVPHEAVTASWCDGRERQLRGSPPRLEDLRYLGKPQAHEEP